MTRAASAASLGNGTATSAPESARAPTGASRQPDLSDSQVLRVLEQRVDRSTGPQSATEADPALGAIELLSPQDTQSWREIRAQVAREATVYFAVQLEWSVSPIELTRVPQLAIFDAYTLYRIEGNRQGRKWYGLRLGFFKDANSAKQVALYVRSEFASVAVVPVGLNEREQAQQFGAIHRDAADGRSRRGAGSHDEEITLIDDRPDAAASPAPIPATAASRSGAASAGSARSAGTPNAAGGARAAAAGAKAAPGARRTGRPRGGAPKSFEETLEILGASQLTIDTGKGETIIDARGRPQPDRRTTMFSKLLDRLSEKLKK